MFGTLLIRGLCHSIKRNRNRVRWAAVGWRAMTKSQLRSRYRVVVTRCNLFIPAARIYTDGDDALPRAYPREPSTSSRPARLVPLPLASSDSK
jgi:hypothetical protein